MCNAPSRTKMRWRRWLGSHWRRTGCFAGARPLAGAGAGQGKSDPISCPLGLVAGGLQRARNRQRQARPVQLARGRGIIRLAGSLSLLAMYLRPDAAREALVSSRGRRSATLAAAADCRYWAAACTPSSSADNSTAPRCWLQIAS